MNELTQTIINNIIKISDVLKEDLWGIRNRVTDKIIVIGLFDDRVIFADATNWCQAKVWNERESVEKVYSIICNLGENFKDNYFVDKLTNDEYENYCKENGLSIPYENFKF